MLCKIQAFHSIPNLSLLNEKHRIIHVIMRELILAHKHFRYTKKLDWNIIGYQK